MTRPKKVPPDEVARLGIKWLEFEQIYFLKKPEVMKTLFSALSLYDENKNYPVFAPNKLVYVNPCEPSVMEPGCTIDRVKLIEESVFCIVVDQADNGFRDDPASIRKSQVRACDLSTENYDGWIEIPIWLAYEKLFRFEPR